MTRLCGVRKRGPHCSFKLVTWDAKLLGNDVETLTSAEEIQSIAQPCATASEGGLAEGVSRVNEEVCAGIAKQGKALCVPSIEHHSMEVISDDFTEDRLLLSHNDQVSN